jgi:hypothetical protein
MMTSPSDKAPIYLMTARVAFKKRKEAHERVKWVISVFTSPADIMKYDGKTMTRLRSELYGKTSKSDRQVIIRDIISKKFISNSQITLDEHRKQNSN